ncbi:MAG: hypothetical protein IJX89_03195 [Alphaproteobacteria bacterium]|nr:hypothetical protein [Alphaproteobacteria bacterium]
MNKLILLCFLYPCIATAEIASTKYASDATNISSGTVDVNRLPIGTTEKTVAAGDDVRFDSIPTSQPTASPDETRALIWIE